MDSNESKSLSKSDTKMNDMHHRSVFSLEYVVPYKAMSQKDALGLQARHDSLQQNYDALQTQHQAVESKLNDLSNE